MTYQELKEYQTLVEDELFYSIEKERLKQTLKMKVSYYSSPSLTGTPSGNTGSPTERIALSELEYGEQIRQQLKEVETKHAECVAKIKAIKDYINSVSNEETRAMLRRHIYQNASFSEIAKERFVSRNYVAKRIKRGCNGKY